MFVVQLTVTAPLLNATTNRQGKQEHYPYIFTSTTSTTTTPRPQQAATAAALEHLGSHATLPLHRNDLIIVHLFVLTHRHSASQPEATKSNHAAAFLEEAGSNEDATGCEGEKDGA